MSSCRVFEITELLTAVCENSDDATCARLARTSRLLFEIATPILWAHIVGAHKVLVLLPGSIIGRVKLPAPTPPAQKLIPPRSVDYTRFDIYAPLVKSLEIYDSSDLLRFMATIYNWPFLHSIARYRDILPNLLYVTLNQTRGVPAQEKWTATLATRKLRAVYTPLIPVDRGLPFPQVINILQASTTLAALAEQSPGLQLLEIFPLSTRTDLEVEGKADARGSTVTPGTPYRIFCNSLGNLVALRRLSITVVAFEASILRALSNLRHLETLYVHKISNSPTNLMKDSLPRNAFPSLTKLTLIELQEPDLQRIWDWPPLVEKLHSLTVRTTSRRMTMGWTLETFIPLVRIHSPRITEFLCESISSGAPFKLGLDDLKVTV